MLLNTLSNIIECIAIAPTGRISKQYVTVTLPIQPLAVAISSTLLVDVVENLIGVQGTISDPYATVTVNGVAATISDNNFSARVSMADAVSLTANAVDDFGQTATDSVAIDRTAPENMSVVTGNIFDFKGNPVEDATVTLVDDLGAESIVTTDVSGSYYLATFNPGLFTVVISKSGYFEKSVSGSLLLNQTLFMEDGYEIHPEQTTTYTLTAAGPGGTATVTHTVTVIEPKLPEITFLATPDTLMTGESATLSWEVANAVTMTIDNGIGAVSANGSLEVTPTVTTTYVLTTVDPQGTNSTAVTITVTPPKPIIHMTANPGTLSVANGGFFTLRWQCQNADSSRLTRASDQAGGRGYRGHHLEKRTSGSRRRPKPPTPRKSPWPNPKPSTKRWAVRSAACRPSGT